MEIKTRENNNIMIMDMEGKLDINCSMSIKECLNRAIMEQGGKVLLNLSNVDFINSSGLGILVSALKILREEKGQLKFCCLQKYVRELFEISQLTNVFSIYETEKEALEKFS